MKYTAIILILLLLSVGCKKEKAADEYINVYLDIPVSIYPIADTIKTGDTLYLTANIPDTLYEYTTKKFHKLPNINFETYVSINKLVNPNTDFLGQPGAIQQFNYFSTLGQISNFTSTFADVQFSYGQNRYRCSIGMIARAPGVYSINFNTYFKYGKVLPEINLGNTESGGKKYAVSDFIAYRINNGQNHFSLFKQHCKPSNTPPSSPFQDSLLYYTFVVK